MTGSTFPGGTSVSRLDVYESEASDGICGGTPHMHLVSTEAYVVVGGRGALQTIDGTGFAEVQLEAGSVVWFTPGTIHRAINLGDLRVVVLMSDAGLPESGDAVMTFPPEVVSDPDAYAAAASLGAPEEAEVRSERRRDLAVRGFIRLRAAAEDGEIAPLNDFYTAAGRLVTDRAADWGALIEDGPLAQAQRSLELTRAVAVGEIAHLGEGHLSQGIPSPGARRFGMCGRLRTYDL
ncbi:MAG: cupin domain-containing protein [Microbacteriaceae bacterium]